MSKNILEATEASLILCQVACQVDFHPDKPTLSPPVPIRGVIWTALPADSGTAPMAYTLIETAAPDTATSSSVGSEKKIQYHAQPTEGTAVTPRQTSDPDSDITLEASYGESDGDSYYVES